MLTHPLFLLILFAVIAGILYLLFKPNGGRYYQWRRSRQLTERILIEDALKHLYKSARQGGTPTIDSLAGALQASSAEIVELLPEMEKRQLLDLGDGNLRLTNAGKEYALQIIRAHRLWEQYLAHETGYAEAEWHDQADIFEHNLSVTEADALSDQLGRPMFDPHGDPIPTAEGELISQDAKPLSALSVGDMGRIVHLEDEPKAIYAQLVAEGLHVGMSLQVSELTSQRVGFWSGGAEHVLAPILANNVSVVAMTPEMPAISSQPAITLAKLSPGQTASVVALSPNCRGAERRRFMDLGILPGTKITAEIRSPGGDPTAYNIRGALIALRRNQADMIQIAPLEGAVA